MLILIYLIELLEKFYMLMNMNIKELNHKYNMLMEKLVLLDIHI